MKKIINKIKKLVLSDKERTNFYFIIIYVIYLYNFLFTYNYFTQNIRDISSTYIPFKFI